MADKVADESESDQLFDLVTLKNTKLIVCKICGSKILRQNTCSIAKNEFPLPYMKSKDKDGNSLNDKLENTSRYWLVEDMMTFENVGFSKTVNGIKYLVCADCEIGPIGYQDTKNLKYLYVAVSRVKYT
ncbi:guanine nucleotide exchange factor MSS4-like [Hydractinia symbiolongicarpus]|uniref:guanine nucleotide exchange factor MSS4-like n=1 Tax=Hydractinia symbiolongicarpus TaxID=13093 RepID=UPI00254C8C09|nr:guanine nucleotide exchange factor MSS4-like [Hydractinia symbiolongicarpus]